MKKTVILLLAVRISTLNGLVYKTPQQIRLALSEGSVRVSRLAVISKEIGFESHLNGV